MCCNFVVYIDGGYEKDDDEFGNGASSDDRFKNYRTDK